VDETGRLRLHRGVFEHPTRHAPDKSLAQLHAEVAAGALADAGLSPRDVDEATRIALARAGMKISDIDLYEVNEAFASVPLAWLKELGGDPDRLNVHGGAIALGHPLGASGAKLMTTLICSLRARQGRYGLLTMCEGGGLANVTIVERL
jgi:acetyl-CoA acetyltransferase